MSTDPGDDAYQHTALLPYLPQAPLMTTTEAPRQGEAAYRVWLGHTVSCCTCRAGAPCLTAVQLGRAWRAAR